MQLLQNKNLIFELILRAHECDYISLRNDLINDIKHLLTDNELEQILKMIDEKN